MSLGGLSGPCAGSVLETRFMKRTAMKVAPLTMRAIEKTGRMDWENASLRIAGLAAGARERRRERSELKRPIWIAPRSETPIDPPRLSVKVARPEAMPISLF